MPGILLNLAMCELIMFTVSLRSGTITTTILQMRKEGPDSLGLSKILEQIGGGPRIPTLTFRLQNPEHTAFPTR